MKYQAERAVAQEGRSEWPKAQARMRFSFVFLLNQSIEYTYLAIDLLITSHRPYGL
jgi:hypothetical protein